LGLIVMWVHSAWADYRLDAGDVVEITVFGVQGLTKRTAIDVDGDISMPLLGRLHAAGQSLATLRELLQARTGANVSTRGADVTVDLIQCRPFYISGDVRNAGSYPYVPGLTVRQAVAIAGGFGLQANRPEITSADVLGARARLSALSLEATKLQIQVAGLQAEANGASAVSAPPANGAAERGEVTSQVSRLEDKRFAAQHDMVEAERSTSEQMIAFANEEIDTLETELKQDTASVESQTQEATRVQELVSKGLAQVSRLMEEWRAQVLLKSRQMDTAARLALAKQQREQLQNSQNKLNGDRRIEVLQKLQNAVVELGKVRAQMNGEAEKLAYFGETPSAGVQGAGDMPQVAIYRRGAQGGTPIDASADAPVEPGDVIEVKAVPLGATGVSSKPNAGKVG
jgi:polysaccharide export outer membrane protein